MVWYWTFSFGGPHFGDSKSGEWDPLTASGEEERQKLMALQEKKENGDKEADANGHNITWI